MTRLDRSGPLPGYFASPWPVECGGNRRQKAASGGLSARSGSADVTTRRDDRWHVMTIRRAPGEIFVGGTMPAWSGPEPHGWLQRIDPETLEVVAESPTLPAGGHVWCGAIAAHANGDIYKVNGCYMHRLDMDCQVVTERRLPVDQAHNGLLILSDGSIVTKDLRLAGQGPSTVTHLSAEGLEVIAEPFRLPEGSMGRIASDLTDDGEFIYIPGIEHVWRIRVEPDRMTIDPDWSPLYRRDGGAQGLSWDGCISAGSLWLMDNGDIDSLRAIYGEYPNGRFEAPSNRLSWRRPAPWSGPQRLLKVSLDTGDIREIAPFGTPGGGIIAPPVHVPEHGICIAWDSINGGLAGIADDADGLRVAWTLDARPSMQPVVFPETGELVINDFRDNDDRLIVVDIPTGAVIDDVSTGSRVANGMFLTPGGDRDIYYCSTFAVARVQWG
jgi:hypothetical protein